MEVSLSGPILTQKKTQRIYHTKYPSSTRQKKKIMVIILIYMARVIFLLFCVRQDTKYEERETNISIDIPIFTKKKVRKALCDKDIYTLQDGKKCGSYSYL